MPKALDIILNGWWQSSGPCRRWGSLNDVEEIALGIGCDLCLSGDGNGRGENAEDGGELGCSGDGGDVAVCDGGE